MKPNTLELEMLLKKNCPGCNLMIEGLEAKEHEKLLAHFEKKYTNIDTLSKKKRVALNIKSVPTYIVREIESGDVLSSSAKLVSVNQVVTALKEVLKRT